MEKRSSILQHIGRGFVQSKRLWVVAIVVGVALCISGAVPKFGLVNRTSVSNQAQTAAPQTQRFGGDASKLSAALKQNAETIQWVENKGQLPAEVLYSYTTPGSRVFVERNRLVFEFFQSVTEPPANDASQKEQVARHSFVVNFDGANPNAMVTHGAAFATTYNYFVGSDPSQWTSNVAAYKELTLQDLYPGISLRLYSQANKQLEYDWIVAPGADYRAVNLRVEGADNVAVAADGSLDVALRFGSVHFNIPEAYQVTASGKQVLNFAFAKTANNRVTFETSASVDPQYPLVIDPTLVWGTWFDGNNTNFDAYLFATAVDPSTGYIYCAGYVNVAAANGYLPSGGYDTSFNTGDDAIVYALSSDGKTLVYATYYGGNGTDHAYGLSLSTNRVFIVGEGGTLPTTGTPFDSSQNGGQDGFVAAFTKDLSTLSYASYIGTSGADAMYSIRAFGDTSYVVSGFVNGALTTSNPNYLANSADSTQSGQEGYIAKFGTLNTLTFGTYVGGTGNETLNDIQVMSDGRIAFVGNTTSTTNFPSEVNSQAATGTGTTGFVGTIPSGGGSFQYLDLIGGSGADFFNSVTVDNNDIYWTGTTQSSNFPLGSAPGFDNSYSTDNGTPPGGSSSFPLGDMLIAKVTVPSGGSPSGYKATYYGCTSNCGAGGGTTGVVISIESPTCANGTKYLMIFGARMNTANGTIATQNINNESFYNATYQGTIDMFIMVLNPNLDTSPYFATYAGGAQSDYFGATGVPHGANHLTVNGDQFILGTTSHSTSTGAGAHVPQIVGDSSGSQAAGSVFDPTRSPAAGTTIDAHIIFALTFVSRDYGDAPSSYGTATASHQVSCITLSSANTLRLGNLIDTEGAGNPSNASGALVDDQSGSADEEGVVLNSGLNNKSTSYSTQSISVLNNTGQTATLYGWIDFNRNGTFDTTERASITVPSSASPQTVNLTWSGLSGLVAGQSYARFRITTGSITTVSSANDALAAGAASDGEIEDYPITIESSPTAVTLASFTARSTNKGVRVAWKTGSEMNMVGFNVWRKVGKGDWKQLNATPIDAAHVGQVSGGSYSYLDKSVKDGKTYRYKLEILTASGESIWSDVVPMK